MMALCATVMAQVLEVYQATAAYAIAVARKLELLRVMEQFMIVMARR